jgi:coiled-coil domain-containing protein 61
VPKKFNIFVKMLVQALRGGNDQVCIDLLTQADLEALKSKKSGGPNTSMSSQASNTKRYIILTYITEFERVHYPLSLTFVEEPEPDQLRRTIERMRNMILMQKSNAFSVQSEPMKSTGFN